MTDLSNADTDSTDKDKSASTTRPQSGESDSTSDYNQNAWSTDASLATRYTVLDYYALTIPLISGKSFQSLNVHSLFRTLVDFLLSHSLQLRALQKREVKFGDLSFHTRDQLNILMVKSLVPKTTQFQYNTCVRHKLVELCPHFILAMYLFARFHIADTFGELDLKEDSFTDSQFLEFKLLNGGKKLRPLSYSQQYKASTKVLKIMDEFKPINLGKILTSQHNTDPHLGPVSEVTLASKPLSSDIDGINPDTLCRFAGFEDSASYSIDRDAKEPPDEVVIQIFPFLNNADSVSPKQRAFFQVLRTLRRSLVQDMVEVKKKFPENALCDHPIFKSLAFTKYAGLLEEHSEPNHTIITPYSIPRRFSRRSDDATDSGDDGETPVDEQEEAEVNNGPADKKLWELEKIVRAMHHQNQELAMQFRRFVEEYNQQQEYNNKALFSLINTTNGLSILLTSKNANASAYVQQVLNGNLHTLEAVRAQLTRYTSDTIRVGERWKTSIDRLWSLFYQYQQEFARGTRKRKIASIRGLSPSVTSLKEMWDDYKEWESEMVEKGVSLNDWVINQPKVDRNMRESRAIIVNFVEREASRQNAPLTTVLEKLEQRLPASFSPSMFSDLSRDIASGTFAPLDTERDPK